MIFVRNFAAKPIFSSNHWFSRACAAALASHCAPGCTMNRASLLRAIRHLERAQAMTAHPKNRVRFCNFFAMGSGAVVCKTDAPNRGEACSCKRHHRAAIGQHTAASKIAQSNFRGLLENDCCESARANGDGPQFGPGGPLGTCNSQISLAQPASARPRTPRF